MDKLYDDVMELFNYKNKPLIPKQKIYRCIHNDKSFNKPKPKLKDFKELDELIYKINTLVLLENAISSMSMKSPEIPLTQEGLF